MEFGGTALLVFIITSCLGTCNGYTMAAGRSFYSITSRGQGPNPKLFNQVDAVTNSVTNAGALTLFISAIWLVLWGGHRGGWFHLPLTNLIVPITISLTLIPIFIAVILKQKDMNVFNRFIAPSIGVIGASFMIYATIMSQGMSVLWYMLITLVILAVGGLFLLTKPKGGA